MSGAVNLSELRQPEQTQYAWLNKAKARQLASRSDKESLSGG
jgi:phosphatidylserine decarboxylase